MVGVGAMGGPIARRLRTEGPVVVYDTNPEVLRRFGEEGFETVDSVAALAASSDVVVCMLPHPDVLAGLMLGEDGLGGMLAQGSLIIDMATDGPAVVRLLRDSLSDHGVAVVDAPVGRGPKAAAQGELLIFLGGEPSDRARARSVLAPVGSEFFECGELGTGQALKLANNFVQSSNIAVLAEAVAIADAVGLDIGLLASVMSQTAANSFQLSNGLIGKALKGDYSPIMRLDLTKKDMTLAMTLAEQLGVEAPLGTAAKGWFDRASDEGSGDLDQTALLALKAPSLKSTSG
jgi:3-hydroxyisobutyrate dehydrogenase-like beta-hydroxyacid dehydrogenase